MHYMLRRAALFLVALTIACYSPLSASAITASGPGYDELREAAIRKCQAIDPADYRSGLFFNPDGHRSYYVQSECFQRTAEQCRDQTLCSFVKERPALFLSSWAYSTATCESLVASGVAADQSLLSDLKQRYLRGAVQLRNCRLEQNGNGRDVDIIPEFSGAFAHAYVLQFELLGMSGNEPVFRSGFYLDDTNNIRVFVRYSDLLGRVAQLTRHKKYDMRAALILDVGRGSPSGLWSDAFVERVFPMRERTQTIDREVSF